MVRKCNIWLFLFIHFINYGYLLFRKKFLFISKEQATYYIALVRCHHDKADAEKLIRETSNPLELQHEFYCQLYPQIINDISSLEENWRAGNHRLQRINCESENSKGMQILKQLSTSFVFVILFAC